MLSETENRLLWASAMTFTDLCDLMVRYVSAELPSSPTYGGSIDSETGPIIPELVALNRSGLLTTHSQPAFMPDSQGGDAQRAAVEGFAVEETALRFAEKALYTDLHIQVFPPGSEDGYQIPITVSDRHPYTWTGRPGFEYLEGFQEFCSAEAMQTLLPAWYVIVIDLQWGRDRHLWETLLAPNRPGYSTHPHPDLGVAHGFHY